MKRISEIVLCLIITIFYSSTPATAQKPTIVRGAGASSCADYVQVYDAYRPFAAGDQTTLMAANAVANYAQYEA